MPTPERGNSFVSKKTRRTAVCATPPLVTASPRNHAYLLGIAALRMCCLEAVAKSLNSVTRTPIAMLPVNPFQMARVVFQIRPSTSVCLAVFASQIPNAPRLHSSETHVTPTTSVHSLDFSAPTKTAPIAHRLVGTAPALPVWWAHCATVARVWCLALSRRMPPAPMPLLVRRGIAREELAPTPTSEWRDSHALQTWTAPLEAHARTKCARHLV